MTIMHKFTPAIGSPIFPWFIVANNLQLAIEKQTIVMVVPMPKLISHFNIDAMVSCSPARPEN